RWSAAYVLGGASGNALASGDAVSAMRANARLVEAFQASSTPDERRHWAGALGNVGAIENVERLVELGGDADASVRATAAWALRKTDTDAARAALVQLAGDESP